MRQGIGKCLLLGCTTCSAPDGYNAILDQNQDPSESSCQDLFGSQPSLVTFMATKTIVRPSGSPAAVGPYNHGVRVGDLLFCAGQIPLAPATGNLIEGGIEAQAERVLLNIKAILDSERLGFNQVVKTTVFLTDLADFAAMNAVYGRFFTGDFPARSTIQVAALPKGAKVEIEIIAHY